MVRLVKAREADYLEEKKVDLKDVMGRTLVSELRYLGYKVCKGCSGFGHGLASCPTSKKLGQLSAGVDAWKTYLGTAKLLLIEESNNNGQPHKRRYL